MTSGRIGDYLGFGDIADRPATLDLSPDCLGIWYSVDTAIFSSYTTTWADIPTGGGNVVNSGTPTIGQVAEWLDALTVKGVNVTGTGNYVKATSPTLVTPALGTPGSGVLTNTTGLPISTGLAGAGTGVLTALGANIGSAGAPLTFNGALGTPSSGTLTNATGLPLATGVTGDLPFANLAQVGALSLLGNVGTATADAASIPLGAGLTFSAGSLATTGGGGSGDVVGPASAVNGNLAVFDGPTGKLLKDGGSPAGGGTVTNVVVQGGPFLTNSTITATGTITNSVTTLTNHGVLLGQATSAPVATAVGTDGQLLIGQTTADPTFNTMSGDATITKAGAITVTKIGGVVPAIAADKGAVLNSGTVQINNAINVTGTAGGTLTISPTTGTSDVIITMPAAGGTVTVTSAPSFARQRMLWDIKQGATFGVLNLGTVFNMTGPITSFTLSATNNAIDRLEWMSPNGTVWVPLAIGQGFTI